MGRGDRAAPNAMALPPARSLTPPCARAGHDAAVDHELRTGHVARGVGGEEQDAVGDVLRLSGDAQRYGQARPLVRVDRRIAPVPLRTRRYLAPYRRIDDAGMHRVDADV